MRAPQLTSWDTLDWYIHDHRQQHSEMVFFARNGAFNLTWRKDKPLRKISSKARCKGVVTERGADNHSGDHSSQHPGLPEYGG